MPTKLRSFIFAVNLFLVFRAHKRPSFFLHTPHKNPLLIIKIDEILPAIILIIFFRWRMLLLLTLIPVNLDLKPKP